MKKKLLVGMMMALVLALGGCGKSSNVENTQTSTEANMESIIESVEENQEESNVDNEEQENEETPEIEVEVKEDSKEEPKEETIATTSEDKNKDYLKGVNMHTLWIKEMTAKEANITSIGVNEYGEDTKATVVGVMFLPEEGSTINKAYYGKWYTKDNEEYIELEESSLYNTWDFYDDFGYVIGRFPADKVDVNNLYLKIYDGDKRYEKYFKIEPDNLYDIYNMEASENIDPLEDRIVYFHDIPFFISKVQWDHSYVSYPDSFDLTNYSNRTDPCIDQYRTITLIPLTGQTSYDFSFIQTAKLSDNYITDDYEVFYTTRWDYEDAVGTLYGNGVKLVFYYRWYYSQDEYDTYINEHPDEEYNFYSGFFDKIENALYESDLKDTYLLMENENKPDTKLYFWH